MRAARSAGASCVRAHDTRVQVPDDDVREDQPSPAAGVEPRPRMDGGRNGVQ
jgi:hypothetical protein